MSVLDLMTNYASNSTAHGLPRLAQAKNWSRKVFWAIICLGALIMFCIQGTILLQRYLSYPKSVALEVANQPIPFPSVSICNLRPLDVYTFGKILYDDNEQERWATGDDLSYEGRVNSTVPAFEKKMIDFANNYISYSRFSDIYSHYINDSVIFYKAYQMLLSRMTLAANFDVDSAIEGGTQAPEFFALCEYAGNKCTYKDFTWFLDPAYFNCFTFNPSRGVGETHSIYEGPDNGLTVILFVPNMGIMNYSDEAAANIAFHQELSLGGEGVRLVVHGANTVPYPLTEGLDVQRGISASVGIGLSEYERMGLPHGNCSNRETLGGLSNYSYTMASCKKLCLQKLVIESCGCADISLPISTEHESGVKTCAHFDDIPDFCRSKENITDYFDQCRVVFEEWFFRVDCMRKIRSNISKNLSAWHDCECHPPCYAQEYEMFMSLSNWPMEEQAQNHMIELLKVEKFHDNFPEDKREHYFGDLLKDSVTATDYKTFVDAGHFIRLNIYISDTSVIRIIETEGYGMVQLVSDIGGQLGLWIGVSLITIVEVLELFTTVFHYLCLKLHLTKKENGRVIKNKTSEITNAQFPAQTSIGETVTVMP